MENTENKKESLKERMSFLEIDTESVKLTNDLLKATFESDTELQNILQKETSRELNLCYSNAAIVALQDTNAESAYKKLAERELKGTELGKRLQVNGKLDGEDLKEYTAKVDAITSNLRTFAKNSKGRYYNYSLKKATMLDTDQKICSWAEALWTEYINRRTDANESKKKQSLEEKITAKLKAFANVKGLSANDIVTSVASVCKCAESEVTAVIKKLDKEAKAQKESKEK